jgi:hypothetical protein
MANLHSHMYDSPVVHSEIQMKILQNNINTDHTQGVRVSDELFSRKISYMVDCCKRGEESYGFKAGELFDYLGDCKLQKNVCSMRPP